MPNQIDPVEKTEGAPRRRHQLVLLLLAGILAATAAFVFYKARDQERENAPPPPVEDDGESYHRVDKKKASEHMAAGLKQFEGRDYEAALSSFFQAMRSDPDNKEAREYVVKSSEKVAKARAKNPGKPSVDPEPVNP